MTKIHWRLVSNRLLVDIKGNMSVLMACCHAGIFFFFYYFVKNLFILIWDIAN